MNDAKVLVKFEGDTKNLDNATSQAKKGLGGIKGFAKGAGIAIGAGVAAGVAKAGAALVDLTKQSLKARADFEQYIGGTKLLFGDAANYIEKKAKSAYKTAGLSANQYLAQVNGFAVGLKNSLGGNEKAAAKLADKIITAEADIVAATGNSQEAVQNAFNGIMKGNFTMLDNLQLGIKPTKKGMEEVIKKVNDWNKAQGHATKYQMDNLADMQAAVVDYVKMQGVAGYAAREATDTISGSISATKAAWENFLAGTGSATEVVQMVAKAGKNIGNELLKIIPDITNGIVELINGLLPQIPGMIGKLLPVAIQGIVDLVRGIVSQLPNILKTIFDALLNAGPTLIQAIISLLGMVVESFITWVPQFLNQLPIMFKQVTDMLISNLPTIIDGLIEMVMMLVYALPDIISSLIQYIPTIIIMVVTALLKALPQLIKGLVDLVIELVKAMPIIIGDLIKALPGIVISICNTLLQSGKELLKVGKEFINDMWTGIKNKGPELWNKIKNFAKNIPGKIVSGIGNVLNIGKNLVQGLWNGIQNAKDWVLDKIKGFGTSIINGIKSIFGIHSPSKVMFKIGQYVVEGFKNGMTTKDFKNIGSKLAKNFINGISSGLEKIKSVTDKLKSNLSSVDLFSDGKITDLGAIKDQVINYGKNLSKLKSKLPSNLYEEILGMGREEGLEYTNQLLAMDKGSLNEYINNWKTIQKQSSTISKKYYDAEVKALKDNYTNQLKKQFGTVKHTMGGLGKNAMKGLYDGMKSELKKLSGTSKKISNSVVSSFKKSLKIKSPSRVMYELGNYTTQGFINGITSLKDELNKQMSKTFNLNPSVTNSTNTHFSPNVNVINNIEMKQDPLGQMVNNIKTFQGGAKNDYNYGKA